MTQELTKSEELGIEEYDAEALRKAKIMSGESSRIFIPFIPIIQINNKKEKKTAVVDGQEQEVEMPAKKGFIVTNKGDDGKYDKSFLTEDLSAGILKIRYQIESKYEKADPPFRSNEFDRFDEIIQVFNIYNRDDILGEGSYKQLKELFKSTEKDRLGNIMSLFSLNIVLYLDYEDNIYRFKWRATGKNNWFDYASSFGEKDTPVAYKTNFILKEATQGNITFWHATAERGDKLILSEQLAKQAEIHKFFAAVDNALTSKVETAEPAPEQLKVEDTQAIIEKDKEQEELDKAVSQIPF